MSLDAPEDAGAYADLLNCCVTKVNSMRQVSNDAGSDYFTLATVKFVRRAKMLRMEIQTSSRVFRRAPVTI